MNNEKVKNFGLLGYPLSHSLSPFIHSELLRIKGIDGGYRLYETPDESLAYEFNNTLINLSGFNVTIPHKTKIIPFLSKLSEKAELYGAVNTVEINDGVTIGHNTDCTGFLKSLELEGIELKGRVLVCGYGGVARMFAAESIMSGAEVTLGIRRESAKKAQALSYELESKLSASIGITLLGEAEGIYDIIINGTPVGMFPNALGCPVSDGVIMGASAVFDAVYNPYRTVLLRKAEEYGKKYINGLPMLVIQAAAAEEIWNSVKYTEEEIRRVIELTKEELNNE